MGDKAIEEIARRLESQRIALGVSISQLARLSKVHRSTVSRVLSGGTYKMRSLSAVAKVLGAKVGTLTQEPSE